MQKEAIVNFHQIAGENNFEAGIPHQISKDKITYINFMLSLHAGFLLASSGQENFTATKESRFDIWALLLESFALWLQDMPDYEPIDIKFTNKSTNSVQFEIDCLLNGFKQTIIFTFTDHKTDFQIVFSSEHTSHEAMQIALLTLSDYLLTQLNTTISQN